MRRLAPLLLLAACREPIGDDALRFEASAREVALGRRFELSVSRAWPKGGKPEEWESDALGLRLVETRLDESGGRVRELRRFDAYAFGDVDLPGLDLTVRRAIDPGAAGEPELPGRPASRWGWWVAGGVALLAVFLLVRRRRPRAAPVAPEPAAPAEPPHVAWLRRLAALRARDPSPEEWADGVAALLRESAGGEEHWSTEELLARDPRDADLLAAVLGACDRVKFARHEPGGDERDRVFEQAETYLRRGAPA